jgi:hypothetical protein
MGGEGVVVAREYLWYIPYTEESKLTLSCVYSIL